MHVGILKSQSKRCLSIPYHNHFRLARNKVAAAVERHFSVKNTHLASPTFFSRLTNKVKLVDHQFLQSLWCDWYDALIRKTLFCSSSRREVLASSTQLSSSSSRMPSHSTTSTGTGTSTAFVKGSSLKSGFRISFGFTSVFNMTTKERGCSRFVTDNASIQACFALASNSTWFIISSQNQYPSFTYTCLLYLANSNDTFTGGAFQFKVHFRRSWSRGTQPPLQNCIINHADILSVSFIDFLFTGRRQCGHSGWAKARFAKCYLFSRIHDMNKSMLHLYVMFNRSGRVSCFTSGDEHPHKVEKVSNCFMYQIFAQSLKISTFFLHILVLEVE